MKKLVLATIVFLSACQATPTNEEQLNRDDILKTDLSGENINEHTCKRVEQFGKGKVSNDECLAQVNSANAECHEIVKSNVPETFSGEHNTKSIVRIMMTCPMAKILEYEYQVINGEPKIGFPE